MSSWDFYTTNEINPLGWLRRQLKLQADGLCGHLDTVWLRMTAMPFVSDDE